MRYVMIAALVSAASTMPAQAQDRTGYTAIMAGDLAAAETTLRQERAIFPNRPELMLNLAAVYARTNRDVAARSLYSEILSRDAVQMELADGGSMSSHDLARAGLQRLGMVLTAR